MSAPDSDVAVIGAGVVDASVACHRARAGVRVAMLDPEPGGGASVGHGQPGMTLAPAIGVLIAADLTARSRG
ncbi:FAD-binding oxidoreductase [Streptosporangium roseum]|uniref:FAD-binding oxidoreductase n=1 Tax=Streptosporangium roseum TaxID=2001 RepID=UPI0001A3F1AA|nr:FAD-binding oxidoreductase [Streptosporangium roseum]